MKRIAFLLLFVSCAAAAKHESRLNVIPEPRSVSFASGSFSMKGADFNYDPALDKCTVDAIASLSDAIYVGSGKVSSIASASGLTAAEDIKSLKGVFFLKGGYGGYACDVVDGMIEEHEVCGAPPSFAVVARAIGVAKGVPLACLCSFL